MSVAAALLLGALFSGDSVWTALAACSSRAVGARSP